MSVWANSVSYTHLDVYKRQLLEGLKLTKKAAKVGLDWENAGQIFDKLNEETAELKAAIESGDTANVEEEVGDLLLSLIHI